MPHRVEFVALGAAISRPHNVTSGVPQGSVLGPDPVYLIIHASSLPCHQQVWNLIPLLWEMFFYTWFIHGKHQSQDRWYICIVHNHKFKFFFIKPHHSSISSPFFSSLSSLSHMCTHMFPCYLGLCRCQSGM